MKTILIFILATIFCFIAAIFLIRSNVELRRLIEQYENELEELMHDNEYQIRAYEIKNFQFIELEKQYKKVQTQLKRYKTLLKNKSK